MDEAHLLLAHHEGGHPQFLVRTFHPVFIDTSSCCREQSVECAHCGPNLDFSILESATTSGAALSGADGP